MKITLAATVILGFWSLTGVALGAAAQEPVDSVPVPAASEAATDQTAAAAPAAPEQWMTRGAEALPPGRHAVGVFAGVPSIGVWLDLTAARVVSFELHLSYEYLTCALPLPERMYELRNGMTAGLSLKFKLFAIAGHAMSLNLDSFFTMTMNEWGYVIPGGAALSPEIAYSYRWNRPRIGIVAGIRVPYRFMGEDVWFVTPVLFKAGLEFFVARGINLHALVEAGFFHTLSGEQRVEFMNPLAEMRIGISYMW